MKNILLLFIALFISSSILGQDRTRVHPNFETGQIIQLAFDDSQVGHAITSCGNWMTSTNFGDSWTVRPFYDAELANDADDMIIVPNSNGEKVFLQSSNLIYSEDAGSNWSDILPDSLGSSTREIHWLEGSLYVFTSTDYLAVTDDLGATWNVFPLGFSTFKSSLVSKQIIFSSSVLGDLYKSENGGADWTLVSDDDSGNRYFSLKFFDENLGFRSSLTSDLWKTTDGGVTWDLAIDQKLTSGIIYVNENLFIGRSNQLYYAITNQGSEADLIWYPREIPPISTGFFALDENHLWAYGLNHSVFYNTNALDESGWTQLNDGYFNHLFDVDFKDADEGAAVDGYGRILQTKDGGDSWDEFKVYPEEDVRVQYNADGNLIVIADNSIDILATDGTVLNSTTSFHKNWLSSSEGRDRIFVTGNSELYLTTDGGMTWTEVENFSSSIRLVQALDNMDVLALLQDNTLHKSTDNGQTWSEIYSFSSGAQDWSFVDALTGFIVHADSVRMTKDGGNTWSAIARKPAQAQRMSMKNEMEGWIIGHSGSATNQSKVYHTVDGGITWTKQEEGCQGILNVLVNKDSDDVFFVGQGGNIERWTDAISSQQNIESHVESRLAYPNPASDFIILDIEQKNAHVQLWNAQGQLILEQRVQNTKGETIDISKLSGGFYYLVLSTKNERWTQKLLLINK